MTARGDWRISLLLILLILAAWEIAGQFRLVADGTLPALSAILGRLFTERGDYTPHIVATLSTAGLGFVLGNVVALLAAAIFHFWPTGERLFRGVNIAIFAVPPIALVPVLVIALDGATARTTLAALLVYFPTMTAAVAGLRDIDRRSADVITAYGGNRWAVFRLLRVRAALPAVFSGLQVAAPAAVLGAILAEFGSGARWGLGTFLLGSLGRAEPDRLWGIGLTATAIAGFGYALAAGIAALTVGRNRALTLVPSPPQDDAGRARPIRAGLMALAVVVLPFVLWHGVLVLSQLSPIIAKTPLAVFDYLFVGKTHALAQARLLAALMQTVPITLVGMVAGLVVAFGLALLSVAAPVLMRALLPFALVTQTMPLVALTPLAVLICGRGVAVTLVITISVTFFAAYVVLAQGLAQIPRAAFDLADAYGASTRKKLWLVAIPASRDWLFVAARLALPKALLGVMIAEWLATGKGLGNLLNQSRGYLDYGMIWSVALISVLIAVALYQITDGVERLTRR
jgi:sulfonate transport system permease protein